MAPQKGTVPEPDAAADGVAWETIPTGSLGEEWNFEHDGPLIGNYIGSRKVETTKIESGEATAHQFAPLDRPDDLVFVWESKDLEALSGDLIRVGDLLRITFLGERAFTSADGQPRRIKTYKIEAAPRAGVTTG
jgi:hypothetical protein